MTDKILKGFAIFGSRVEHYLCIDSTQKRARDIFKQKKEEALILASAQTGGLGRRDNKWESPPGGLYLSVIIKDNSDSILPVSIKALLAALETFKKLLPPAAQIKWKWPNDLIFEGRKVGGILSEKPENGWAIVGLGINTGIEPGDLSPAVRDIAALCNIDRDIFPLEFTRLLKSCIPMEKLTPGIKKELEERLILNGKDIVIGSLRGKVAGLADDGRILLDSGEKISYGSPTVVKPVLGPTENILAIDIGNTSARIGYADKTGIVRALDVPVMPEKDFADRLISGAGELNAGSEAPTGVAVSSVSDRVRKKVIEKLKKSYKVRITEVSRKNCAALKLKISPETVVGADRLANAVAVRDYYGGPAVVVDLGTANTFDIIDREGAYLGGIIAPGVESMKDALVARADKLSDFEITAPEAIIGKDTQSCMRSGFYFTLTGQINEILNCLRKESGVYQKVIFTGGWVNILDKAYLQNYIVDRNLTLKGIMTIAAYKRLDKER